MLIYKQNPASRGEPQRYTRRQNDIWAQSVDADPAREPEPRRASPNPARPTRDPDFIAPVLLEIERWIKARGMPPTRFGKQSVGDPKLVFDLRSGRDPSSKVTARIRAFMDGETTDGE